MASKIFVFVLIGIILYCLGSALFFMLRHNKPGSTQMAKALTWRVVISLSLFVFLMVSFAMGWMTPHGLIPMKLQ